MGRWIGQHCFSESPLARWLAIGSLSMTLLLAGTISAMSSPLPDLLLLRNVICERESGGLADRDDAVGNAGEIGRCQIRPGTARQVGYQGKNRDLFERSVNEAVALTKLVMCSRKYVTVKGLAWCFNRGLNAGKVNPLDPYVVAVSEAYGKKTVAKN